MDVENAIITKNRMMNTGMRIHARTLCSSLFKNGFIIKKAGDELLIDRNLNEDNEFMERFVLNTKADELQEVFGVTDIPEGLLTPAFNAAPGHTLPVIVQQELKPAFWDMNKPTIFLSSGKESFFERAQACIIPINGFYMWKQTVNDPLPFYVRVHTRKLLGIAGILTSIDGRSSFRVLIRESSVLLKPLDDIMPCILEPSEFYDWLRGEEQSVMANGFSHNLFLPDMSVYRVPDLVNDLSNNSPELIQPIPKLREDD